eukprot:1858886-Alexandrium_andersonii.AAC.1
MTRASRAGSGWARVSEATSTSSPRPWALCSPAPPRGSTRASATTPSSSRSAGASRGTAGPPTAPSGSWRSSSRARSPTACAP